MLPAPTLVTVLVLVSADEGTHPERQLESVVRGALEPSLHLSVLRRADAQERTPEDPEVAAVVSVVWNARVHTAIVRVLRVGENRRVERRIVFDPTDDESECTRTVGLSIASMLPPELRASTPATGPETKSDPIVPSPPSGTPTPQAKFDATDTKKSHPGGPQAGPAVTERFAFDISGKGALGGAPGLGGGLGFQWMMAPWAGFRAELAFRSGSVSAAEASLLTTSVGAGLVMQNPHPWLRPAVRLTLGLHRYSLSRDLPLESHARYQPALTLGSDLALRAFSSLWVTVGLGIEVTARQPILVQSNLRGDLAPLTGYAAIGLRIAL